MRMVGNGISVSHPSPPIRALAAQNAFSLYYTLKFRQSDVVSGYSHTHTLARASAVQTPAPHTLAFADPFSSRLSHMQ